MTASTISSDSFYRLASELMEVGQAAFRQGWVPATSGNFSARLQDNNIAITVSGAHKGHLETTDIIVVDRAGKSFDQRKPSAETLLHTWLYEWRADIQAVLHTHSVGATCLSLLSDNEVVLEGFEVLKAFAGIDTHESRIAIPVFNNDQDIERLSSVVGTYLKQHPDVPGYLIAGHGLYTWGDSIAATMSHLEAFEFFFNCSLQMRGRNPI